MFVDAIGNHDNWYWTKTNEFTVAQFARLFWKCFTLYNNLVFLHILPISGCYCICWKLYRTVEPFMKICWLAEFYSICFWTKMPGQRTQIKIRSYKSMNNCLLSLNKKKKKKTKQFALVHSIVSMLYDRYLFNVYQNLADSLYKYPVSLQLHYMIY